MPISVGLSNRPCRGELTSVDDLMEKTFAVLASGGPVEFVTGKLNELKLKQADLTQRLRAKDSENRDFLSRESRFHSSKDEIRQLVEQLQSPATDELFNLRAQIASKLKVLIETLLVAPLGDRPRMQKSIDHLKRQPALMPATWSHTWSNWQRIRINPGGTSLWAFGIARRASSFLPTMTRYDMSSKLSPKSG